MRHAAVALLSIAIAAGVQAAPARAQASLDNSQVEIAYVEPRDPAHRPLYERLRQRRVLEQLKQFLAPLRIPAGSRLLVRVDSCVGEPAAAGHHYAKGVVTICYDYLARVRALAPSGVTPEGWKPEDAIVGPFVEVVLHGVADAIFDILEVPVWGREADAADNLGGFIMWQFGKEVARRTLSGVAYFHQARAIARKPLTKEDFADNYATDWQRFYSFLCMAHGGAVHSGDERSFRDLSSLLPKFRRERCDGEFQQVQHAFRQHILPHIDQALLAQVQAKDDWLQPGDGR